MRIVTCDFRRKNKRIVLSKRFWYCCSGIKLLETFNSVINYITTESDCGLPNGTKLTFVNVLHTFQKVKTYIFH